MEEITPQSVLDLFWRLTDEERDNFIRLLGKDLTAEAAYAQTGQLDTIEHGRYVDMLLDATWRSILPSMVNAAIRITREHPNLTGGPLEEAVFRFHQHEMSMMGQDMRTQEAERLREKRNRKSSPETIRRNLEICNFRKQNAKHWSHGRLARKFGVTDRAIRSVLKQEAKWRHLALKLRTD